MAHCPMRPGFDSAGRQGTITENFLSYIIIYMRCQESMIG